MAYSTSGTPWPRASPARKYTITPARSPPAIGTSGIIHSSALAGSFSAASSVRWIVFMKARATPAVMIPIAAATRTRYQSRSNPSFALSRRSRLATGVRINRYRRGRGMGRDQSIPSRPRLKDRAAAPGRRPGAPRRNRSSTDRSRDASREGCCGRRRQARPARRPLPPRPGAGCC